MTARWHFALSIAVGALSVLSGCAGWSTRPTSVAKEGLLDPTTTTTTGTTVSAPPCPRPEETYLPLDSLAELHPIGPVLWVGVDDNTRMLSARDATTNGLEGFEVDLAKEIGRRLGVKYVRFKIVTTETKTKAVADGDVDLTIDAVSITCKRWQDVAFSAPYFAIRQRVMVLDDSDIVSLAGLNHRKVCVTKGSTSLGQIKDVAPDAEPYEVTTRSQCLVALEQGTVDAIFAHETFLWGFEQQDPHTRILPDDPAAPSQPQYYGIAVQKDRVDLVRAINMVLADPTMRSTLEGAYKKHFLDCSGCDTLIDPAPPAHLPMPPANYGRELPPGGG